jgi:two-component system copper resistance phosphate regulon response regulator CusR
VARRLRKEGFAVDEVACLVDATEALRLHEYDCLVFDRMVPDGDAVDLVNEARQHDDDVTPVLLLSARDAVAERVAGFAAGADDYVTKPFELTELAARVRALCRRRGGLRPSRERCGDLVVDRALRAVRRAGVLLSLTPKEFALLEVLVDARGAVVSRAPGQVVVHAVGARGGADVEGLTAAERQRAAGLDGGGEGAGVRHPDGHGGLGQDGEGGDGGAGRGHEHPAGSLESEFH